jgi:hypothetical protein
MCSHLQKRKMQGQCVKTASVCADTLGFRVWGLGTSEYRRGMAVCLGSRV